jgi:hypothetical protein
MTMEVLQQVKDLKEVREEAEKTPVGEEAPEEKKKSIEERLEKTNVVLEKLKKIGETSVAIGEKLGPILVKALPLIAGARHLFGLP